MAPVKRHTLQSLQVIAGALLMGVIAFSAAVVVVGLGRMLVQFPGRGSLRSALDGAGRQSY